MQHITITSLMHKTLLIAWEEVCLQIHVKVAVLTKGLHNQNSAQKSKKIGTD